MISFTRTALVALTLGLTLGTVDARADVLFEPFAGYQIGQAKQSGQKNVDFKTTNYGARLGYGGFGLMAGVEYLTGQGVEDTTKAKTKPTSMGVFLGYTLPVLLRLYGVYGFDTKFDRRSGTATSTYSEGTSVKFGLGITSLSFVAINIEYMTATYGKVNNAPTDHKYLTGSYGLALSFPLSF